MKWRKLKPTHPWRMQIREAGSPEDFLRCFKGLPLHRCRICGRPVLVRRGAPSHLRVCKDDADCNEHFHAKLMAERTSELDYTLVGYRGRK